MGLKCCRRFGETTVLSGQTVETSTAGFHCGTKLSNVRVLPLNVGVQLNIQVGKTTVLYGQIVDTSTAGFHCGSKLCNVLVLLVGTDLKCCRHFGKTTVLCGQVFETFIVCFHGKIAFADSAIDVRGFDLSCAEVTTKIFKLAVVRLDERSEVAAIVTSVVDSQLHAFCLSDKVCDGVM
ncbi:hypothetical protein AAVH_13404 [Aphelenchoides avenae]|nr:hypothetical protein AAVH_13404 [Aphelenchus avenae]